jgi:hypothetical protein
VCFVAHKTISEQECVILATLFLPVQKIPTELDSNLLEEKRNTILANVQKYQESMKRYYNKSVVPRELGAEEGYPYKRQA